MLLLAVFALLLSSVAAVESSALDSAFGGRSWLPSALYVAQSGDVVIHAILMVGSDQTERQFAVDFSSPDTYVAFNPLADSSSATRSAGRIFDMVWIGGHSIMLHMKPSAAHVARANCSICEGVLGLGHGSPLWLEFREVLIEAGRIVFDPPAALEGPRAPCSMGLGSPFLCQTPATVRVGAYSQPVNLVIAPHTSDTLVPPAVSDVLRGPREPGNDPAYRWPDLEIEFDGAPGGRVRLTADDYLLTRPLGTPKLTIQPTPGGGPDLVLGYQALRSLVIWRSFETHEIAVEERHVRLTHTGFVTFLIFLTPWLYYRARLQPQTLRIDETLFDTDMVGVAISMAVDFGTCCLPIIYYALLPSVRAAVAENTLFLVAALVATAYTIIGGTVTHIALLAGLPERLPSMLGDDTSIDRMVSYINHDIARRTLARNVFDSDLTDDERRSVARNGAWRMFFQELGVLLGLLLLANEVGLGGPNTLLCVFVGAVIAVSVINVAFVQISLWHGALLWPFTAVPFALACGMLLWTLGYTSLVPFIHWLLAGSGIGIVVALLYVVAILLFLGYYLSAVDRRRATLYVESRSK